MKVLALALLVVAGSALVVAVRQRVRVATYFGIAYAGFFRRRADVVRVESRRRPARRPRAGVRARRRAGYGVSGADARARARRPHRVRQRRARPRAAHDDRGDQLAQRRVLALRAERVSRSARKERRARRAARRRRRARDDRALQRRAFVHDDLRGALAERNVRLHQRAALAHRVRSCANTAASSTSTSATRSWRSFRARPTTRCARDRAAGRRAAHNAERAARGAAPIASASACTAAR